MPSTLTWLDYSENDRQLALEVIDLFGEKETRDELGLASVRDAFADLFFPGTSTIQTRAKYFLFIPWIYLELEKKEIPSSKIAEAARKEEISLIEVLANSNDRKGIIGIDARGKLKRLPSNIYWNGLRNWGIRLFQGSQPQYHRSLDSYYGACRNVILDDDKQPLYDGRPCNWHRGLPEKPKNFPKVANFLLSSQERKYLRERILSKASPSLLAFLVENGRKWKPTDFLWQHPQMGEVPQQNKEIIWHARNFSEIVHGMSLLYNLMLAEELKEIRNPKDLDLEEYRERLNSWASLIRDRGGEYKRWDLDRFWVIASGSNLRISGTTKIFVEKSIRLILELKNPKELLIHRVARDMIRDRERFLKGPETRLGNPRALELWKGWSGSDQIDYRWRVVQNIIMDLIKP